MSTEAAAANGSGHNSAARKQVIQEVCKELAALESERDEISAQIREIKQKRIKGDLSMKIADFNAAYRLYKLDDEQQATFIDALRETFQALGKGAQLDFLAAQQTAEHVREKEAEEPKRGPGRPKGSKNKPLMVDPDTRQPTDDGLFKLAAAVRAQANAQAIDHEAALDQVLCASIWRDIDAENLDRQAVLDLIEEATPLAPVDEGDEAPATAQQTAAVAEGDDDGLAGFAD